MLYKLRPVFVDEPRMNGFYPMSVMTLAWISVATVELLSTPEYYELLILTKIFYVTVVAYMTFWFILNFIESRLIHSRIMKISLIVIPAIDIIALLTNPFHHLYITDVSAPVSPNTAAPTGILFTIHVSLIALGVLFFYTIFIRYIFRNYRRYPLLFITGVAVLIPFLLNVAHVYGLFGLRYDFSPIGYFLTIVLFAYYSYTTRVRYYNPTYFSNTLSRITKSPVLYGGNLDDTFRMIAEEGCKALNVQCITIWKFSDDMRFLNKLLVYEASETSTMKQNTIDMEKYPVYRDLIMLQREFAVEDVKAMKNPLATSIGSEETTLCAYLDAPIRAGGKTYGVISIEQHRCKSYPERRGWNSKERNFTSSLADFMSFAVESAQRKRLEAAVEYRDKLLEAVNQAASVLLTTDEKTNISDTLNKSMELIGSSIGADRVQLWRNETIDGELHYVLYFQWLSELGNQKADVPIGKRIPYSRIPEWKDTLLNGKHINGPISGVSPIVQELYKEYDMASIMITPLFPDNYFWGFFSIVDCENERYFNEDEITIMTSVSLMMINAIDRYALIENRTRELELQTTILGTLFDSIPDLVFVKDLDLNYINCNKSLLEFFNREKKDVIGKNDAFVHNLEDDETEKFIQWDHKVINECNTYVVEETLSNPDGSTLHVETIKAPLIINGNVEGMAGVARDITKRKELEQDIIRARDEAEFANSAKSTFLAKMSHELRTPMNAILGVTEILVHDDDTSDETRDGLDRIYSSCTLLMGIINDILDLSKIEAGKMDIVPVVYKTASMINDFIQLNIMRIESKPLDFKVKIDESFPESLIGDELRITQVMNNLLSNAFKYTEKGTINLNIDFEPGARDDEVMIVITIQDTGVGMTKEQLDHLFDEYSRFGDSSSIDGVGLGLSISKQLVRLMGGDILVKSEHGFGSEFTVRFPQKKVDDKTLGAEIADNLSNHTYDKQIQRERRKLVRDIMPYGSVLVVDDVETNRYVAAGLLKRYRLRIDTAESGFEAIKKVEDGNVYDIIFMDHMMPEMNGIEATAELRKLGYNEPIVALTANVVAGQADVFLNNGFDDFIAKPVDIRLLTTVLNKFIRDKQEPEVIAAARLQFEAEMTNESGDGSYNTQPKSQTLTHMLEEGIDGLDIVKGFGRYHGDEKVFIQILRTYVNDVRSLLDGLTTIDENNLQDYKIRVHGIKGMSTSIYADKIGEYARELESAAESSDFSFIEKSNQAFIDASLKLVGEISVMLDAIEAENHGLDSRQKKDRLDIDVLTKLQSASSLYDLSGVDEAMSEIEQYQYESDNDLVVWLREKVDMMQFMEISEKLSDIL